MRRLFGWLALLPALAALVLPASRVKLDRGLNDLWTRGGLMYALPLQ